MPRQGHHIAWALTSGGIVKVLIYRSKTSRTELQKYYTFLSDDAKNLTRQWLEMRPECNLPHLDKNFNMSNLARAQERKEDLDRNFAVAVNYALENRPDLFLMTGGVFDGNSPKQLHQSLCD